MPRHTLLPACLVPPLVSLLVSLLVWDWHERAIVGPIAPLNAIGLKHGRRAGHQKWMRSAKLISTMAYVGRGQQQPPYDVQIYLPWLERWLRGLTVGPRQPWPRDIVRSVRAGDVVVVLRPMLDEVLAELETRRGATPPFTLVSVNYDDAVTPQLRQRLDAAPALRRVFAQNLMAAPHGRADKVQPLPLGLPTHLHGPEASDRVEQLVRTARTLRFNLSRTGQLLPRILVATQLRGCSPPRRAGAGSARRLATAAPGRLANGQGGTDASRCEFVQRLWSQPFVDWRPDPVPFEQYYETLARYAFVLSPPGNGFDAFRTWEALAVGAVPIVLNASALGFDTRLYDGTAAWVVSSAQEVVDGFASRLRHQAREQPLDHRATPVVTVSYWDRKFRES